MLSPIVDPTQTLTSFAAERFARNCAALGVDLPFPDLDPCMGRDGSATARRDGHWLAGCSVPRRAAEVMLRNAGWPGPTICLLLPTHGQQIAACLDKLGPPHGLIVRLASQAALADAFACCDFADAITAGRLFFAWDDASLEAIFEARPGLAVPSQMVRLPDADAAALPAVIASTQHILGLQTAAQARRTLATIQTPAAATKPWCVLAPQQFCLWNDAGHALAGVMGTGVVDPGLPTTAADAHLAEAVGAAAATVAADRPRAVWAKTERPWIDWVTRLPVPPYNAAYPRDALALTDAALHATALAAGWPADRLTVAGWPTPPMKITPGRPLALIADLPSRTAPADVADLSSRQLVWDAIGEELTRDPFALGDDAHRYVSRAPGRLRLPPAEDFPVQQFVDGVVGPAYLLGIARWLIGQNVPLTLHGRGWADDDVCGPHAAGPVDGRDAFRAAVERSGGLFDPFVTVAGHPARSLGVPLVRAFGRTAQRVLQDVAAARAGRLDSSAATSPLTHALLTALCSAA